MRKKDHLEKVREPWDFSRIGGNYPGLEVPVSTMVYVPLHLLTDSTCGSSIQLLWWTCKAATVHFQPHFPDPTPALDSQGAATGVCIAAYPAQSLLWPQSWTNRDYHTQSQLQSWSVSSAGAICTQLTCQNSPAHTVYSGGR